MLPGPGVASGVGEGQESRWMGAEELNGAE